MTKTGTKPKTVDVHFLIPGHGVTVERYDMLSPYDLASWRANNKLSAAVQLRVVTVDTIEATEENLEALSSAREKSNPIFEQLRKGEA